MSGKRSVTLGRWALALGGGMYVLFGLWLALAPWQAMAQLDVAIQHAVHQTDIRAMYGGMMLAIGGLCLWCMRLERLHFGLLLCGWSYAGIGLVRAAGMLMDGAGGAYLWTATVCELVLAAWAIACAVRMDVSARAA